jgi:hypothetical protein
LNLGIILPSSSRNCCGTIRTMVAGCTSPARVCPPGNRQGRRCTLKTNAGDGQLRHPNVLEYKDSLEIEAGEKTGGGPVLYIVTEPVSPLNCKLNELNLQGADRYHTPSSHCVHLATLALSLRLGSRRTGAWRRLKERRAGVCAWQGAIPVGGAQLHHQGGELPQQRLPPGACAAYAVCSRASEPRASSFVGPLHDILSYGGMSVARCMVTSAVCLWW